MSHDFEPKCQISTNMGYRHRIGIVLALVTSSWHAEDDLDAPLPRLLGRSWASSGYAGRRNFAVMHVGSHLRHPGDFRGVPGKCAKMQETITLRALDCCMSCCICCLRPTRVKLKPNLESTHLAVCLPPMWVKESSRTFTEASSLCSVAQHFLNGARRKSGVKE